VQSGFIWLTTGTSAWPCEYHNEHMGCINLGEIVKYLRNYQLVKMHSLKYAHQNILKIVILGLALVCVCIYIYIMRTKFCVYHLMCRI
jgi:hypothetical protein